MKNKRIFFQDWGGGKKITFSYPSTAYSISYTNLGKTILKIISRGSINKKTSYAYIKCTIKGYSVANKQKEEKVSLKNRRDRDYSLRIPRE